MNNAITLKLSGILPAVCVAVSALLPIAAHAAYPDRPIHVVVPFPPGGSTDVVTRAVSEEAAKILGQPIIIENRGGAGSMIGSNYVAKAAPDGYTLLVGQTAFAVNASLRKELPYDTIKDFTPIALMADHPGVFLAHVDKPYNTFEEFIEYAKANPGKVVYSSAGVGSWPHLSTQMLANVAGLDIMHVAYQGTGPAKADLIAGRIDVKIEAYATSKAMVDEGRLKILAVTGKERAPELPNLPTIAEKGYPGYETSYWIGLLGPAGVPADIVKTLEQAYMTASKSPAVSEKLAKMSIQARGLPAEDLDAHIKAEIAKWGGVIKESGMELQ